MKTTVILGASHKPDRYAHLAQKSLMAAGYPVIPIHPVEKEILGEEVVSRLDQVEEEVHTLTVYVNPRRFAPMIDDVLALAPQRVIFNPGTESPELYHLFPEGVEVLEACTLVMLNTGQY